MVIGVVFIFYLYIKGNMSFESIMQLLASFANLFGILMVIVLLGHGLVAIPKKYWRE